MADKKWDENKFANTIAEAVDKIVTSAILDGRFDITERAELINIVLESMDTAQTIVLEDLKTAVE